LGKPWFAEIGAPGLPFRADSQLLAALGAAAGNYGAAIGGLHTGTETVRLGAVAVIGLESAFWHGASEIFRKYLELVEKIRLYNRLEAARRICPGHGRRLRANTDKSKLSLALNYVLR
jgi:hypothetical protein